MLTIQSVLKKVGFDVLTTSNEFTLSQQVLSHNPDIIIGYGRGPKLSTVGVGKRLREMTRWNGRVILIFAAGVKTDPADLVKLRMDMALEAPLEITRLLQVLANYTGLDARVLVEKMMAAVAQEGSQRGQSTPGSNPNEAVFVTGSKEATESWHVQGAGDLDEFNRLMGIAPEPAKPEPHFELKQSEQELAEKEFLRSRVKSYDKYLKELPAPPVQGHRRVDMKKAQKQLKEDWSEEALEDQDRLRRKFAEGLFKKKD